MTRFTACLAAATAATFCASPFAQADEKPQACDQDARFSQQDFALGNWDVYTGDRKTATVYLERVLNGCGIRETWTPVGKSEGHGIGMFTYSRLLGHWGYFWVADTAQTTAFSGDLQGSNAMLYSTEAPLPGGGKKQRHWTLKLQADGSIQELSVGSTDGQNWAKEYELVWRKRK